MSEHRVPTSGEPPIKAGFEPPKAAQPVDIPPPIPSPAVAQANAPQVVQHPEGFYMTNAQLEQMMINVAKAIKEPSATEQIKLDKAKQREDAHRLRAAQDEATRLNDTVAEQLRCKHINDAKNSQWRGQVLSNGWGLVACVRCRKRYYFYPTPDMLRNGVGLGEPEARGVTEAEVKKWSEESLKFALENDIKPPVELNQFMPRTEFYPIPTESRPRA